MDLMLTLIEGFTATRQAIENNSRYSNVAMIFYVGYFLGITEASVGQAFTVYVTFQIFRNGLW